MIPEEKYENDFWYVLKKIKKESLYHNEKDGSFTYTVYFPTLFGGNPNPLANPIGENNTSAHDELVIIEKLISLKIIDRAMVSSRADQYGIQNQREIKSKILKPKFDEIYKKYEELNIKREKEKTVRIYSDKGELRLICHRCNSVIGLLKSIDIESLSSTGSTYHCKKCDEDTCSVSKIEGDIVIQHRFKFKDLENNLKKK
jgi:hypothetical protein